MLLSDGLEIHIDRKKNEKNKRKKREESEGGF